MKKQHLSVIIEILTEQMNHWILFAPVTAILALSGASRPDLRMWFLTGLFPMLFFFIRVKARKFWVFTGAHLLAASALFLIPAASHVGRILCLLGVAGYLIWSLSLSMKQQNACMESFHPIFAVVLAAAFFLLHRSQGQIQGWEKYYTFSLAGFLVLYSIKGYLQNFLSFVELNASSTGFLPVSDMLRSGLGLVCGYTFIGAVLIVFSTNLSWLDSLVSIVRKGLLALLRAFLSLLSGGETGDVIPEQQEMINTGDLPLPAEAQETFLFWRVLEIAAYIALLGGGAYCLVRLLIWLVRYVRERFAGGFLLQRKVEEQENPDLREKCIPAGKRPSSAGRELPFAFLSPSARIRRLYKKTVLSQGARRAEKDLPSFSCLTARESEARLGLAGMADVYERARYSEQKMTAADVKRMKEACSPKR